MEVKCYDCMKVIPRGEAIYEFLKRGYWLCYSCHKKRKKGEFWALIIGGIIVIAIVVGVALYFKLKN